MREKGKSAEERERSYIVGDLVERQ
jgi:hypothetical protein